MVPAPVGAEPVAVLFRDGYLSEVTGLAAAVWPADGTPDQAASIEQTEQFVAAYEQARGRPWTPAERHACWAPASGYGPSTPRGSACPAAGPSWSVSPPRWANAPPERPGGGGGRVAWALGRVAGEVGVAWA
jgi:hypothetical protein